MNPLVAGQRLGLGPGYARWLEQLDASAPEDPLPRPGERDLLALLEGLGFTADDAVTVARSLPHPDRQPELWCLLERSHHALVAGLANAGGGGSAPPELPADLGTAGRLFAVHLVVLALDAIRACHAQLGVPDDISAETLGGLGPAVADYRHRHGRIGFVSGPFAWMGFCGFLYQVGRLTVTPYRLCVHPEAGPLFWYDDETAARLGPGFRRGDPAIGLHVPPDEPLRPDACDDSLRRIRRAFDGIYPDAPPRIGTCTSWLLDDQLADHLPEHSNIVSFQRRFELVPGAREDDEFTLRHVFGENRPGELDALAQRTTLERAVVSHLRAGGHWRLRTGWLEL